VADAVGEEIEVLADGGVRTGLDVVKFLALGADAVMIGRAWAWAVAAGGERAVAKMLEGLKSDMDTALGLTGQTSVTELDRSALYQR
jgi:L-lactate dehydrogenase (cytochrome)